VSYQESNAHTGDVCTSSMQGSDFQYNKENRLRT